MKCFQIDLNELPKVALWGKEALIPPRLHYSRYLTEYVMYVVIKGELKLMVNEDVVVLGTGDVYIFCNGDLQESLESSFCEYYYVHFCSESLCETELDEAEYSDLINKKRGLCLTADAFSSRCYEFLDVYVKQKTHIYPGELFDSIKELMQNNILTTESKYPEKRLAVSNALSTVLVKLESSSIGTPKSDKSNTRRGYDTARAIAEYIELHYAESITGSLIERKFFLTYDYVNDILYTVKEVSEIIHTNKAYVYELIKAGLLPALKLGSYKIRKETLEFFLKDHEGYDLTDPNDIVKITVNNTE